MTDGTCRRRRRHESARCHVVRGRVADEHTLAGQALISNCTACSGGKRIGFIGKSSVLTFNAITAPAEGDYAVIDRIIVAAQPL